MLQSSGIGPSFKGKIELKTYEKRGNEFKEKVEHFITTPEQDLLIRKTADSMSKNCFGEKLSSQNSEIFNGLIESIIGKKLAPMLEESRRMANLFDDPILYGDLKSSKGGVFLKIDLKA